MPAAPRPPNEAESLQVLHSYGVLDTAVEQPYDEIASLAASLTGSPVALVSLVDADRQWFKAHHGLPMRETVRELAFCAHAILDPAQPLIVSDAATDPRFAANPLVTSDPGIRSYLGVPLVSREGFPLGTLCIIGNTPRDHDSETVRIMQSLARMVEATLELRRTTHRVQTAALTDSLTGLLNRRAIEARLADTVEAGTPVTVVTVDLDHLKEANDADGHAAGDALLRAAADRLRRCAPGGAVGRVGGDEFVVLLPGVSARPAAAGVAARILLALEAPVAHGGRLLRLGATLGVAIGPHDAQTPAHLLRVADEAMVRAKRAQRGSVGWASPDLAQHLVRTAAVLRAFDAPGSVAAAAFAHFQPIVSLVSGSLALGNPAFGGAAGGHVVALEALARWDHPGTGPMAPGELLGTIGPHRTAWLGTAVRAHAFAAVALLRAEGLFGGRLAVNVSACEVAAPGMAAALADAAARAGVPMEALDIEITEDVLQDRVSTRTLDQLGLLRGWGARIVLDNFGTGNAGLMQLLRLPLDGLKLDKRFVQRLGADSRAGEIVRATVSLARGLGMGVVGEGVETGGQAAILRELGCDAAQGFLFGRPIGASALRAWLDGQPGGARAGRVRQPATVR